MNMFSTRKPLFWILFTLFSTACVAFTFRYFSTAFPIANVQISMDRKQALAQAHALAQRYGWGPDNYRQAASFETDRHTQTYVELEVGGSAAFNEMITGTLYAPYTWQVRHFREGETNETTISFKPDGTPYEFIEKIAEDSSGAALSSQEARIIAEEKATKDWGINLDEYVLVEPSQEKRPNGRIDHTFVYERPTVHIGEGRYRLQLGVTGDKFTKLNHVIKIPEGFFLRYDNMRSANQTIGFIAQIALFLLYVLGGCCIGLFILMKENRILWRQPLLWAFLLALLQFLTSFNELPLLWMNYDTASSANNFVLQHAIHALTSFLYLFLVYGISIIAAESLTRKAFGHQIQFWKLWTSPIASSWEVVGRTIGGYLIVGFDLAFIVAMYFITRTFFGWWIPSDPLVNPNILATYIPWFSAAAGSLAAGFWEEMLFRAVPLASAALLGRRFGKEKLFLIIGFVIQALIFGAAHASYPTQPAYGRLIELIIPSFIFGGIYLVFGLLPGIISHVMFDLALMSLPLFVSSAPGSALNQAMTILWGAIPLFVIGYARLRIGAWRKPQRQDYNQAWKGESPKKMVQSITTIAHESLTPSLQTTNVIIGLGILSFIAWVFLTPFTSDVPSLNITRSQAIAQATELLNKQGFSAQAPWKPLARIVNTWPDSEDRFIWQEGGKNVYHNLMQQYYVNPPHWYVRFAKFEGPLEERSEEYQVSLCQDAQLLRVTHQLSEKKSGASLTEEEARKKVYAALAQQHQLIPDQLQEISASLTKHPERTDWTFIFSHPPIYPLKEGQARLRVVVSGDTITDVDRFIHVPETWERNDRNQQTLLSTLQSFAAFLLIIFLALFILYILITAQFSFRFTFIGFAWLVFLGLLININGFPALMAHLQTSQSIMSQLFRIIGFAILYTLVSSASYALLLSFVQQRQALIKPHTKVQLKIAALSIGCMIATLETIFKKFESSFVPTLPALPATDYLIPLLGIALFIIKAFIGTIAVFLSIYVVANMLSNYWHQHRVLCTFMLVVSGIILAAYGHYSLMLWAIHGILLGLLFFASYYYLFRFDPTLILFMVGATYGFTYLQELAFNVFVGTVPGIIAGLLMISLFCVYLYRQLNSQTSR